jgi:predicted negative regulator of RcsB-dependent stress response
MAKTPEKNQTEMPDGQQAAAEFAEEQHPAVKWAQENAKLLIGAVSAIVIVAAGYAFMEFYQGRQLEKAKAELAQITTSAQGAERAEQLAGFAASAPDELKVNALMELAKAQGAQGDFLAAAATWDQVASSTDESFQVPARLGKVSSLIRGGDAGQALAELETLKGQASEPYLQALAIKIANVAEKAGDYERALAAYRDLLGMDSGNRQAFVEYKIRQFERKLEQGQSS